MIDKGIFPDEKITTKDCLYENDPLDVLNFPARVLNTLVKHDYKTVGQFYHSTVNELSKIRNIGPRTMRYFKAVKTAVRKHQHSFRPSSYKAIKDNKIYMPNQKSAHFVPYLSENEKERMKLIKRLYDEYGTLDKVGSLLRLSRERVRQILNQGQKYGLFTYQLTRDRKFDEALNKIGKEQLKESLRRTKNLFDICAVLGIEIHILQRLLKYYDIDLESYKQDARYKRFLTEYSEMVKELGYHPSTTVMQRNKKWRRIWCGINRLWGSFDHFRNDFGIEKPKFAIHSNTVRAWRGYIEKSRARKEEKVAIVYKIIKNNGPISSKKISGILGYSMQSVVQYIHELVADDKIHRIKSGINVKYKVSDA